MGRQDALTRGSTCARELLQHGQRSRTDWRRTSARPIANAFRARSDRDALRPQNDRPTGVGRTAARAGDPGHRHGDPRDRAMVLGHGGGRFGAHGAMLRQGLGGTPRISCLASFE